MRNAKFWRCRRPDFALWVTVSLLLFASPPRTVFAVFCWRNADVTKLQLQDDERLFSAVSGRLLDQHVEPHRCEPLGDRGLVGRYGRNHCRHRRGGRPPRRGGGGARAGRAPRPPGGTAPPRAPPPPPPPAPPAPAPAGALPPAPTPPPP